MGNWSAFRQLGFSFKPIIFMPVNSLCITKCTDNYKQQHWDILNPKIAKDNFLSCHLSQNVAVFPLKVYTTLLAREYDFGPNSSLLGKITQNFLTLNFCLLK